MKNKLYEVIANWAFKTAINSSNKVSTKGIYQPKEPKALKKYKK